MKRPDFSLYNVDPCTAPPGRPWSMGHLRDEWDTLTGARDHAVALPGGDSANVAMWSGRAECAMASYLGVRHSHYVDRVDDGYDFVLPDGRRVDVKWTPHTGGWLAVPQYKVAKGRCCDLFALVTGTSLRRRGWIEYEALIQRENLRLFREGLPEEFGLPQSRLKRLHLLTPSPLVLGL